MSIELLAILSLAAAFAAAALSLLVLLRLGSARAALPPETLAQVAALQTAAERTDRTIRDEIARMRDEAEARGQTLRAEVRDQIGAFGGGLTTNVEAVRSGVAGRMDAFADAQGKAAEALRAEVAASVSRFGEGLKGDVAALSAGLVERQTAFEAATRAALDAMASRLVQLADSQALAQERLKASVEERLEALRGANEAKLEQMRATVEEKLQGTLEKRLGESFRTVSERLESVHKGLGEMQALATGVGDLKRVLTNVKSRGGWGEVQLGQLLESLLAPHQYQANVAIVEGSGERVEFAICLPGSQSGDRPLYLPIDAKFPIEDYERVLAAQEANDQTALEAAARALEQRIKAEAQRIATKYVRPPASTDFGVLYLPTEGLFAEVIRRPALVAEVQAKWRIAVAGPTTLAALLNSLQMGFRTLTIQQRSSEVWKLLGEAKAEFEKYGQVWDKLQKQLDTAQKTVEEAGRRTRAVTRKLKSVDAVEPLKPIDALDLIDDEEG